jgi:hypothetical protein
VAALVISGQELADLATIAAYGAVICRGWRWPLPLLLPFRPSGTGEGTWMTRIRLTWWWST